MMDIIYTDNNATTQVAPEVLDAMMPFFHDLYGNPSSMHTFGGQVADALKTARQKVAALINADPGEILFTGCGTESDNTAIRAAIASNPGKRHILTTRVEHPAIKNVCEHLAKEGYRVTYLPVDRQGRLDLEQLESGLSDDTAIVSIMWANNETGVIFPINEIARIVREKGVVFHTDAVQAAGKVPVDVQKTPVDMLSLSGHKIHAPKGVGVLYVRKKTKFSPFLIGGHQEGGRRGGTENVPSIVGLGKACESAAKHLGEQNGRIRALRDKLENALLEKIPHAMVHGDPDHRLPNTTSISFEYVEGEAILLMMNEFGICASSGSACTSGSLEPSHVLRAMGVPFTAVHGSIRFSLSVYNQEKEIDIIIDKMPRIIGRLRELSPFWRQAQQEAARG
jgi:cysteine desulfurase